jgi:integrase/recombinase XerD
MRQITMSKAKDLTVDSAFDLFVRKCNVNNLTEESITSYKRKIIPFKNYLALMQIELQDIITDTVDDFIVWMRDNLKANDITINSYLRATRAFLYFCMENSYIQSFKIHIPKAEKKMKETYSEAELQVLLKKPDVKKCSFAEYKTYVFENFLLGTGMRLSTALALHIGDINFDDGLIFLSKLKNRRQQYIPLSKTLASILQDYLTIRGNNKEDLLFCNNYGGSISRRTMEQLVEHYNNNRGVMRTSIHAFRHTFAREFILNGGDVFRLQKILCHSSIQVTKEYVDLFGQDLAIGFDDFNPLDNIAKGHGTFIRNTERRSNGQHTNH